VLSIIVAVAVIVSRAAGWWSPPDGARI